MKWKKHQQVRQRTHALSPQQASARSHTHTDKQAYIHTYMPTIICASICTYAQPAPSTAHRNAPKISSLQSSSRWLRWSSCWPSFYSRDWRDLIYTLLCAQSVPNYEGVPGFLSDVPMQAPGEETGHDKRRAYWASHMEALWHRSVKNAHRKGADAGMDGSGLKNNRPTVLASPASVPDVASPTRVGEYTPTSPCLNAERDNSLALPPTDREDLSETNDLFETLMPVSLPFFPCLGFVEPDTTNSLSTVTHKT